MPRPAKELDTSQCKHARQALEKGVKSPMLYRNGQARGGGGGRRMKVQGVFTLGSAPGTLERDGRQVIPHDDAGKALLKKKAVDAIRSIAAENGGAVVKETVVQSLTDTLYLFEATQECLGGIVDAAIEEWKRQQPGGNGGPGQVPVPGQQPAFAAEHLAHVVPPSPAPAAAAPAAAGVPPHDYGNPGQPVAAAAAPLAIFGHPGQPVAAGNAGMAPNMHAQGTPAFDALNAMLERFGAAQAQRDTDYAKDRADDRKDRAKDRAKDKKDRAKERAQTQQCFDTITGRLQGVEGDVKKHDRQITSIQANQRNLEEGHCAHGAQIGNLQEGALQHDAQLGDHNFRLAVLEQCALTSPDGRQALVAATKVVESEAAAKAAAKRKPPSTPTTGTVTGGNNGGGSSPSSSSSDSSFSDRKPSPVPSPDNARGSSATAGGGGNASDGDDLSVSDSDIFVHYSGIRRGRMSQADKDERGEGMKVVEDIMASLAKKLCDAGHDVSGGGGSSSSSSSSSSDSTFSDRKLSPAPSPDNARGSSTAMG